MITEDDVRNHETTKKLRMPRRAAGHGHSGKTPVSQARKGESQREAHRTH